MKRPEIWGREHAMAFADAQVARRYRYRPRYAPAAIAHLSSLAVAPRIVLDLGAGTGNVARPLAPFVARVDALDPSAEMLAEAQTLPGGDDPHIRWIEGAAELAPLDGPYGLATAGASLHWMEWEVVLPRVAAELAPGAALAVLDRSDRAEHENEALTAILARYSVYGGTYRRIDLIGELTERGLFKKIDTAEFAETIRQPLDEYIAAFHSMSSLSIARIGADRAAAFDDEVRTITAVDERGDVVRESVTGITWGEIQA